MSSYYDRKLAASSLERCYELAPPRVQQYLRAEVEFVVGRLRATDVVLDLGCGYGRTLPDLARAAAFVVGIDTSESSLALARERLGGLANCLLARMDASSLAFVDGSFDAVVCIQNGISAFHVDQRELIRESLRVLKPGGAVLEAPPGVVRGTGGGRLHRRDRRGAHGRRRHRLHRRLDPDDGTTGRVRRPDRWPRCTGRVDGGRRVQLVLHAQEARGAADERLSPWGPA
jgi:SAM-dependent methyltransferase